MHATESWNVTGKGAGTYPVVMGNQGGGINSGRNYIMGGAYAYDAIATWGGGNAELQKLGPDGSTYVNIFDTFNNAGTEADLEVGKFTANGSKVLHLSPGIYQVVITTATGASIALTRVPVSS